MSELAELRVENDALRDALQCLIKCIEDIAANWSDSDLPLVVNNAVAFAAEADAQFFDGDPDQQDAESSR